jgi:energy-coupling factor transporter ATP-binding protein EcfA2
MKLKMSINKIKSIKNLEVSLPIDKGLYAITGQNGAGKSTLVTCASSVFFNMPMNDYFGKTDEDASINFELDGATRSWKKEDGRWRKASAGIMSIKGFYEGSLIFGNRFKNTNYKTLKNLDRIGDKQLEDAPEFIRSNLGSILHNDKSFYDKLYKLNNSNVSNINFSGAIFYYQKGNKRVSQFHMSTGENLLVSVLNSINMRNSDRASLIKPCILFLDEIELALHPSSLKRLVSFLSKISNEYNYAIYFSTHSIELISGITPENIFFLERYPDDSLEILNPCYPAYATRILYDHSGYDYVILVEDDLARKIIKRILKNEKLQSTKLIHILPCGGYTNVIDLAEEVISSNLMGKISNISIVLDGDVKEEAKKYIANRGISNNIPLNFLPIESLEKFLKSKLFDNVDHVLFRELNDFIFQQKSIADIISEYKNKENVSKDKNGKILYSYFDTELRARNKSRDEIAEIIVEHLFNNNSKHLVKITNFLKEKLS